MNYVVYIQVNGSWVLVSREFEREHQAQEWALDLRSRLPRRVERLTDE